MAIGGEGVDLAMCSTLTPDMSCSTTSSEFWDMNYRSSLCARRFTGHRHLVVSSN